MSWSNFQIKTLDSINLLDENGKFLFSVTGKIGGSWEDTVKVAELVTAAPDLRDMVARLLKELESADGLFVLHGYMDHELHEIDPDLLDDAHKLLERLG